MHSHVDFVTVAALSVLLLDILLLFTLQNDNQSLTCAIHMPFVFESSTRSTLLALAAATVAATIATAWPIVRSRKASRTPPISDYMELCKKVSDLFTRHTSLGVTMVHRRRLGTSWVGERQGTVWRDALPYGNFFAPHFLRQV